MGLIYKVVNKVNGHIYIGKTINSIEYRWRQHIRNTFYKYREDYNSKFHRAIRKYGANNFAVSAVEECENSVLDEREKYWIKYYDTFNTTHGYNCTEGGGGSYLVSDETRAKISAAESGENNHYYGKHLSDEHKRKIGDAQRGRKSHWYGKHHTDEQIKSMKLAESEPIVAYTNPDCIYMYYISIMSATRAESFDCGHLSQCINGIRKSAHKTKNGDKLHWRRATEKERDIIMNYFIATGIETISPRTFENLMKGEIDYAKRNA